MSKVQDELNKYRKMFASTTIDPNDKELEVQEWNKQFEADEPEEDNSPDIEDESKQDSDEEEEVPADDISLIETPAEDENSETDESSDDDNDDGQNILDGLKEKIHFSKTEIEIIDSLIESETDAISDYTKALNETNNKWARKLYTEILTDESKHLSQLKYIKSMGTDGDYVPKDGDAVDELGEILESIITDIL